MVNEKDYIMMFILLKRKFKNHINVYYSKSILDFLFFNVRNGILCLFRKTFKKIILD